MLKNTYPGTVEQRNDYYAYGGPWGDNAINQGFQPYKYNGKELDRVHGLDWYDYGARMYDPAMGLFTQIDPQCEQYPHLNPYQYCAGNPVKYVDPDGKSFWSKFIKGAIKISKQVVKHGVKALGETATYATAVADIVDDVNVLTDNEAPTSDRIWAGVSLASEFLPVSINDAKDVGKVLKRVKTAKEEQKASRFIVDLDKNVVDLHKTPRGSYKQPNGDRTDILQNKPHFNKKRKRNDGYSHTHPLELHEDLSGNNHPKHSQDTHQPTFDEIMNIINGRAIPIY